MIPASKLLRIEFFILIALLFFLPTAESPKNILLFFYLLAWGAHRLVSNDWRLRWPDRLEWALLMMLLAALGSTLVNLPYPTGFKGFVDSLKFIVVFWCIYRAGYNENQLRYLAYSIALGVLVGLIYGAVEVIQKVRPALEFHSAGVVTQSSIYLGVSLMMTIGVLLTLKKEARARVHVFWWITLAVMVLGLVFMASRGSIVAVVISTAAVMLLLKRFKLLVLTSLAVGLALFIALVTPNIFDQHRALTKIQRLVSAGHMDTSDAIRFDNWRIAVKQITDGDTLWLGFGPMNFSGINRNQYSFDPPLSIPPNIGHAHAHNMFLTKFAEEGILGFAAFMFFYLLIVVALARDWRAGRFLRWQTVAAFGGLTVPSIAGSFNAPFYQEHAILAMALFAIYLCSRSEINHRNREELDVRDRRVS